MEAIGFGREVTSHLQIALQREWLVTNGIGGYASSTIILANTRRHHGLLVAALDPPLGRTAMVSKLEVAARLGGDLLPLTTNEYTDGTINPHGYRNLESFSQEGLIPLFTWAIADALLEQRIWMRHGQNTTFVTFTLTRASYPIALEIVPLCTYREADGKTDIHGWMPSVRSTRAGLRVDALSESIPYWIRAHPGTFVPGVVRHWSLRHRADSFRGEEDREDVFAIGRLDSKLSEGETLAIVLTTERDADTDWHSAYQAELERQRQLLAAAQIEAEPAWVRHLALAADQFVVDTIQQAEGKAPTTSRLESRDKAIVAGYPWLGAMRRETMVALPGLTLVTGRPEIASNILHAYACSVDRDLKSNRYHGQNNRVATPNYGMDDAGLWFFFALQRYVIFTGNAGIVKDLYRTLVAMLEWHIKGTGWGLSADEEDGLLRTRESPLGLTWMDAQFREHAVTPRIGKPVEVNALWYNALATMAGFATELDKKDDASRYGELAAHVAERFASRFWYEQGGYLFDVVDGPEGDDATLRPNQILAVSVPFSPLQDEEKVRAVVNAVARELQTSYGLRTLSPRNPAFAHRIGGNASARSQAVHQGTVWAWLIGPFVAAHLKVNGDLSKARSFLRPFADHLIDHGVGSISEIFDGDPPHTPRGCIASATSVAQVLCAWRSCSS